MDADEQDLVRRLAAGDPAAFGEAFRQHKDRLYRLAFSLLHDPDEAEEAVQESFIILAGRISTFEGRSRLGTWLYRVAYNESLQRLRRRSTRERSAPEEVQVADSAGGPEDAFENLELRQRLDRAILELPESLRTAFLLRDVEGLSTAEAADLLGISPGALKVRLHRARLSLRERVHAQALPATTMAAGISCAEATRQVSDYLDGALAPELRARIEAHVGECDHCRITLDSTRQTLALASERRSVVLPPPRSSLLFERLQRILASRG